VGDRSLRDSSAQRRRDKVAISIRAVWELFGAAFKDWSEDKAARLAAALAYYAAISLAPLLVVLLGIAGLALGPEAAAGQLAAQIQDLIGQQSAQAVQDIIAHANRPAAGIVSTAAGTAVLLLGAAGVFGALQDGLNTIWEVEPQKRRGLIGMVKDRFLSLTMVLGIGFLLLVSLVISAVLSALGKQVEQFLPLPSFLIQLVNALVSFVVIGVLFALIYKVLPDVEIAWTDVWIGAALTSLLFTIGKFAIGLYLGRSSVGTAYGAAGSFVVILIWIYYSTQVLFFGAELTQVYANRFGSRIRPAGDATPIEDRTRAENHPLAEPG
jgi:membrane protein